MLEEAAVWLAEIYDDYGWVRSLDADRGAKGVEIVV